MKTNYSSIEELLGQSLHRIFVTKLLKGKPTFSQRAQSYFKIGKPLVRYQDPVIIALEDLAKEAELEEKISHSRNLNNAHPIQKEEIPSTSTTFQDFKAELKRPFLPNIKNVLNNPGFTHALQQAVKDIQLADAHMPLDLASSLAQLGPSKVIESMEKYDSKQLLSIEDEDFEIEHEDVAPIANIVLLKQHLEWLSDKSPNIYKKLGITPREIEGLWEKRNFLTDEQEAHIQEVLNKAREIRQVILKRIGLDNNDIVVEKERKKHINKRYNVKDTWLPLQ